MNQKATTVVYWPMILQNLWGKSLTTQRGQNFAIRRRRTGSASFLSEVRRAVEFRALVD